MRLGGDGAAVFTGSGPGSTMEASLSRLLEQQFGSVVAWKREFVALANAGHINAASGFGEWPEGYALLNTLRPAAAGAT